MKFSTEQIVAAPRDALFSALTDFGRFERDAIKSGAEVHRTDTLTRPGEGMGWRARFDARGRTRELIAELDRMRIPGELVFAGKMSGMEGELAFTLTPIGPDKTRLVAEFNLRARSISAKLLLNSLKLARGNIDKGFRQRVKAFCRQSERPLELA
jgi:hypothetical protein